MSHITIRLIALAFGACLLQAPNVSTAATADDWAAVEPILARCTGIFTEIPGTGIRTDMPIGPFLGNGEIAAVIGGTKEYQTIHLNRADYWARALGGLSITAAPGKDSERYRYEQDLAQGEIRAAVSINGHATSFSCRVAINDPLLLLTITNPSTGPVTYTLSTWTNGPEEDVSSRRSDKAATNPSLPFAPVNAGAGNGVSFAWREQTKRCKARAVIACRVLDRPVIFDGTLQRCTLAPGESATVVIAADGKSGPCNTTEVADLAVYRAQAMARVNRQTLSSVRALDAARRDWWRAFWLRSFVELGDPLLDRFWYGAFYTLGACARSGQPCPGICGPWVTSDNPSYGNIYVRNYNVQAPFYGVFSGNRPELADPFFETEWKAFQNSARSMPVSGYRGVVLSRYGTPVEGERPLLPMAPMKNRGRLPNDQLESSAFSAMNFIERYDTTQDPVFLSKQLYPVILACVDFYDDYLVLEPVPETPGKSRYVLNESAARQGTQKDKNTAYSLGLLRRLYASAIEASITLGRDGDRRDKWRDIVARMSDYPTAQVDGKRCFKECENDVRITLHGPGDNPCLLQFIMPGNQISLDSPPQMLETARNTLAYLNSDPKRQSWNEGDAFAQIFAYAARSGWNPEDLHRRLCDRIKKNIRNNQIVTEGSVGTQTCGGIEAIHSMLLQSHDNVLRLFPCWPKAKDARFVRLRARGAFVVSAEIKTGAITGVKITSEKGRDCTLVNPWPGKFVRVIRNGKPAKSALGERFTLKTNINETLELQPES